MKINLIPRNDVAEELVKQFNLEGKVLTLTPRLTGGNYYLVELSNKETPSQKKRISVLVNGDEDFTYSFVEEEKSGSKQSFK